MKALYGGIEAGGTKCICAVGTSPMDLTKISIPTTTPEETIREIQAFFAPYTAKLSGLGIGSFGPIDLNRTSPTFGHITCTPKAGWTNTDIVGPLQKTLRVPTTFDTDVNAAILGEWRWGAARGLSDALYITIGTGIGGGVISGGQIVHGLLHPEMGHILLPKHPDDEHQGTCPYHSDMCFEGLASGPAIEGRWGQTAASLENTHEAWLLEAHYIALALSCYICTLSPQRIILGGGVMEQCQLFPQIRRRVQQHLNGYIQHPALLEQIDRYIVPPDLGRDAGIAGAIALAQQAA